MKRILRKSKRLNGRGSKNKNFNTVKIGDQLYYQGPPSANNLSGLAYQSIQEVNNDNEDSQNYLRDAGSTVTDHSHFDERAYLSRGPQVYKTIEERIAEFHLMLEQSKSQNYIDIYHYDKLGVDLKDLDNIYHPIDYALPH